MKRDWDNARRKLFVAMYVDPARPPVWEIAKACGFGPKSSKATLHRLGKRLAEQLAPEIAEALAQQREKNAAQIEIGRQSLLFEMARVSYSNPKRLVDAEGNALPLHLIDDDTARAIRGVELIERYDAKGVLKRTWKYKLWDKNAAHTNLARAIGVFRDPAQPPGADSGSKAQLREMIAALDPAQRAALEKICETVEAAEEARLRTPLIEQKAEPKEGDDGAGEEADG